jgi:ABC-2 type transport system permease protein
MSTRVAFTYVEVGVLLAFARLALGVPVRGALVSLLLVCTLGALCFSGMGLAVACRARKIETVSGLMNVVMLPMFVGSGVFFSIDRFPAAAQPWLRALPLSALNDALRAVSLEGADLASQALRLGIVAAWGVGSFLVGLRLFRWS